MEASRLALGPLGFLTVRGGGLPALGADPVSQGSDLAALVWESIWPLWGAVSEPTIWLLWEAISLLWNAIWLLLEPIWPLREPKITLSLEPQPWSQN